MRDWKRKPMKRGEKGKQGFPERKLKTMQQKQKQNSPGMGAETRKKEMAL